MFVSLQDIAPESSRLKGVSLKDYKIVSKINVREIILGDFNNIMDKMGSDGGNKVQRLY